MRNPSLTSSKSFHFQRKDRRKQHNLFIYPSETLEPGKQWFSKCGQSGWIPIPSVIFSFKPPLKSWFGYWSNMTVLKLSEFIVWHDQLCAKTSICKKYIKIYLDILNYKYRSAMLFIAYRSQSGGHLYSHTLKTSDHHHHPHHQWPSVGFKAFTSNYPNSGSTFKPIGRLGLCHWVNLHMHKLKSHFPFRIFGAWGWGTPDGRGSGPRAWWEFVSAAGQIGEAGIHDCRFTPKAWVHTYGPDVNWLQSSGTKVQLFLKCFVDIWNLKDRGPSLPSTASVTPSPPERLLFTPWLQFGANSPPKPDFTSRMGNMI